MKFLNISHHRNAVESNIAAQKKLQEAGKAADLDKRRKSYQRGVQGGYYDVTIHQILYRECVGNNAREQMAQEFSVFNIILLRLLPSIHKYVLFL